MDKDFKQQFPFIRIQGFAWPKSRNFFFLIWLQDQNSISSPFCRIIGSACYPSTAVAHPETSERY